jgi:hypothetical protein
LQPSSPLALTLRSSARQFAPVIYTVAVSDGAGVWGPFLDFDAALQVAIAVYIRFRSRVLLMFACALQKNILFVLRLIGALTPALKRALCALSRHESVMYPVRMLACETLVGLALEQGSSEGPVGSVCHGIAAVVSLVLGRRFDAVACASDVLEPMPAATVAAFAQASVVAYRYVLLETDSGAPGGAEVSANPGWGWQTEQLCGADAFLQTLWSADASISLFASCIQSEDAALSACAALEGTLAPLFPVSSSSCLPSAREAIITVYFHKLHTALARAGWRGVASEGRFSVSLGFSSAVLDAVTVILERSNSSTDVLSVPFKLSEKEGVISAALLSSLCAQQGTLMSSWLERASRYCAAALQSHSLTPHAADCVEVSVLRRTLMSAGRLVAARGLYVWWRGTDARPALAALSKLCVTARSLAASIDPDRGDYSLGAAASGLVDRILSLGLVL